MYSLNQVKMLASCGRDPARSLPLWRGFLLIPLVLVCFAFSLKAAPAPQTPDPGSIADPFGTADGASALSSVSIGIGNSAFGWFSLAFDTDGSFNTGCGGGGGGGTLVVNTGDSNTAVGAAALLLNTDSTRNTAVGTGALVFNGDTVGSGADFNGAFGAFALFNNINGFSNNAMGDSSLFAN